ncbi:MAG: hypothetical protein LBP81_07205 [Treponema sp.]|jgi:hypothetical protein|nr:hypothetical protein [Treponema sp.]
MTFQRPVIIAVCVSLGAGFLSFFLFRPAAAGGGSAGGYGALSVDQAYSDRMIGQALHSAGIETYFSESTQWVYLDDFGELVKVPLDEYSLRLEPFDPRNDGYAEKLRSFFVRNGTRRFFIPLNPEQDNSPAGFADRLSAALGDTPYTLKILDQKQTPSRYWLLFAVFGTAVLFSLVLSETPFPLAFLIPLCVPLVFLGSPGMVLTGTLFAFSSSLIPPLRKFFAYRRGWASLFRRPPGSPVWEFPVFSCLLPLLFAVVYGVLLCIGNIPALAALAPFLSCCCVTGTVLWAQSNREEHPRFHAVPIKEPAVGVLPFFRYFKRHCPLVILPWVPAAVLALVLPLLLTEPAADSAKSVTEILQEDIPELYAEDYEAHLTFQRSFSLRLLEDLIKFENQAEHLPYSDYYRYSIGDDGFVMEVEWEDEAGQTGFDALPFGNTEEFPPFPLADLMGFLTSYTPAVNPAHTPGDLVSIVFILTLTLPLLIRGGRKERKGGGSLAFNDKRIAA